MIHASVQTALRAANVWLGSAHRLITLERRDGEVRTRISVTPREWARLEEKHGGQRSQRFISALLAMLDEKRLQDEQERDLAAAPPAPAPEPKVVRPAPAAPPPLPAGAPPPPAEELGEVPA